MARRKGHGNMSYLGAPAVALRHMTDVNIGFGMPSDRYNARNAYRGATGTSRDYDSTERWAAGVGTAAAGAVPALALKSWAKPGLLAASMAKGNTSAWLESAFRVGGMSGWQRAAAVGVGATALGGTAVVGAGKFGELLQDDGHYGVVGSAVGIMGGFTAGKALPKVLPFVPGKYGAALGGALAIGGGIAGYKAAQAFGEQIPGAPDLGAGHIGEPHANETEVHHSLPGTVQDYGRGFFNHFTEAGPTSQGVSFSNAWGMREPYAKEYSKSERGGAMSGDLTAAAILGGGALATGARIVRGKSFGVGSWMEKALVGHHVEKAAAPILQMHTMAEQAGMSLKELAARGMDLRGAKPAIGITAAALGAGALYTAGKGIADDYGTTAGLAAAGTIGAAGVGTYALGMRNGFARSLGGARPMANMVGAAVLMSALSAARMPVQQFVNDAKGAWDAHGKPGTDTMVAAGGAGALAGGVSGFNIAKAFTASNAGKWTPAIRAAGALAGAGAAGAALVGVSPTLPDAKTAGVAAGIGAGALGGLSFLLTRNLKSASTGVLVGGVAGTALSSVAAKDAPPAAEEPPAGAQRATVVA